MIQTPDIRMNAIRPESVNCLKYRGSVISDDDVKPYIIYRLAETIAVITNLKLIRNEKSNRFLSELKRNPPSYTFVRLGPEVQNSEKECSP